MKGMQKLVKRGLTALLVLTLVLTSMPVSAYAAETADFVDETQNISDAGDAASSEAVVDASVSEASFIEESSEASEDTSEVKEPVTDEAKEDASGCTEEIEGKENDAAAVEASEQAEDEADTEASLIEDAVPEEEETPILVGDLDPAKKYVQIGLHNAKSASLVIDGTAKVYTESDLSEPLEIKGESFYVTKVTAKEGYVSCDPEIDEYMGYKDHGEHYSAKHETVPGLDTKAWGITLTYSYVDDSNVAYIDLYCNNISPTEFWVDNQRIHESSHATVELTGIARDADGNPETDIWDEKRPLGTQIDITATPKFGYEIKSVTYSIHDGEKTECESAEGHPCFIPEDVVKAAMAAGKDINIWIETKAASMEIKFIADSDFVWIYGYEPVQTEMYTDVIAYGNITTRAIKDSTYADYNSDFYFVVEPSNSQSCEIVKVLLNGTELTPQTDRYYADDSADEYSYSMPYYALKVAGENTIEVVCNVLPAEEGASFEFIDDAPHAAFAIDKKYATLGSDKKRYTFVKGTKDFTFTVTSDYKYDPVLEVGHPNKVTGEFEMRTALYPTDAKYNSNKTKRTFTYRSAPGELDGYILKLTESEAMRQVFISTLLELTLTADGKKVGARPSPFGDYFELPIGTKVVVTFKVPENHTLEVIDETDEDNPKTVATNNGVLSFTLDDHRYFKAGVTGIPTMYLDKWVSIDEDPEITPYADKAKVNIGPLDHYTLQVNNGEFDRKINIPITEVKAMMGKKEIEDFATLSKNDGKPDGTVIINAIYANTLGTTPIAVTIEGEFGTKTLNFVVAQVVSSVSLKGFKDNKIDQVIGTSVSYPVTLNAGGDYSYVEVVAGDGTDVKDFEVNYSPEDKTLTVNTFRNYKLSENDISIDFLSSAEKGKKIDSFTVHPTVAKLPAPTAKAVNSTDVGIDFSVGLPKSVKDYHNLWYKIEAEAVGAVGEDMFPETVQYFSVRESLCHLHLCPYMLGNGRAQKYNVKVSLIQVKNDNYDIDDYENRFAQTNIFTEGTAKLLKNQSTKNPFYETKLGFTKKSVSITYGDERVLLATAKYSAKTTWQIIDAVEIVKGNEKFADNYDSGEIGIDNNTGNIYLQRYPENLVPGTYTLRAYPRSAGYDAYVQPATMTLTVKPSVTKITLTPSGEADYKIYKPTGKAASYKIKATCSSTINGVSYKPANTKVTWQYDSKNPALEKSISVKNGTISIAKNYSLDSDPKGNVFRVRAVALDREDYPKGSDWTYFAVMDSPMEPDAIVIGGVLGGTKAPAQALSTDLNGAQIMVYEKFGYNNIPVGDLSFTVSPSKGLTIDPVTGTVSVTKLGTYTVKATSKDGGKKSVSAKFKVISDTLKEGQAPYKIKWEYMQTAGAVDLPSVDFTDDLGEDLYATIYGAYAIRIVVEPNTENGGLISDTFTITGKGAKKLTVPGRGGPDDAVQYFFFKPTQSDMEFTLSSKEKLFEKVTCKVHNVIGAGTLKVNKKGYSFYANDNLKTKTFEFELTGVALEKSDNVQYALLFDPDEKDLSNTNKAMEVAELSSLLSNEVKDKLKYADTQFIIDPEDPAKPIKVTKTFASGVLINPKGSYSFYVTLIKGEKTKSGVELTQLTTPVKMTLKFTDAPKPSVTLNKKITLENNPGASAPVVKSVKNAMRCDLELFNDNNGQLIDAKKYFRLQQSAETGEWVLVRNDSKLPEGMKSITCWIGYSANALNGGYVTKEEKIVVTFK